MVLPNQSVQEEQTNGERNNAVGGITKRKTEKNQRLRELRGTYSVIIAELEYLKNGGSLNEYDKPFLASDPIFPTIRRKTKSQREIDDELLAEEAELLRERAEMMKNGQWSILSVKKSVEPARNKTNWDYMLEEMEWLSKDFAVERKHKMGLAKKAAKSAVKHVAAVTAKEKKKRKDDEASLRKHASAIAKLVRKDFWAKLEKIVQIRNQTKVDLKKNEFLQRKQDYLVEKSEKLAQYLSQDLVTPSTPMTDSQNIFEKQPEIIEEVETHHENEEEEPQHHHLLSQEDPIKDEDHEIGDFVPDDKMEDEDDDDDIEISDEEEDGDIDYSDEISDLQNEMDVPVEELLKKNYSSTPIEEEETNEERKRIAAASSSAEQFQPTGFTLSTTKVRTQVPELMNQERPLREYQIIGLDWLVTMHDRGLNGILADEMGLGKTIMTIAALANLAEQGIWGPHLVVVPASVLLNWEIEFKRWCPSFKILAYYGTQKQRQLKRKGWNKPDTFHVCITSYNLVVQDKTVLKKKKWHYMILDEAHHIKNFKSQCWQTLLNFNTHSRLLLTGTPLQNSVMELWSLMHFLMPQIFQSHSEFKEWFANPVSGMVEGTHEMNRQLIQRLHAMLRPFLLRRLKRDVAKQLPNKYEHVVPVKLSKRQRLLYEDFMSKADTRSNLISGNFFKIINVLMQLRKVCNHPDLFETRPIISPFETKRLQIYVPTVLANMQESGPFAKITMPLLGLQFITTELWSSFELDSLQELKTPNHCFEEYLSTLNALDTKDMTGTGYPPIFAQYQKRLEGYRQVERKNRYNHYEYLNAFKCNRTSLYTRNTVRMCTIQLKENTLFHFPNLKDSGYCQTLADCAKTPERRAMELEGVIKNFVAIIPKTRAAIVEVLRYRENPSLAVDRDYLEQRISQTISPLLDVYHESQVRTQVYFPDKRLLQYDCGKLQVMAKLLRDLKAKGHRVLIFTQMSQMLNILEAFLSMHNYSYFRLDGATKLEQRQYLTERFNTDPKIFAFILSTRSGGLGINLTGADTVIFYDSDWNPAMDAQAQDRCHRIGQTREVHIYRLISESTVEERILMKANQKRKMNDMVIHNGGFTPELLQKLDVKEFFDEPNLFEQTESRQQSVVETPQEVVSESDLERMLASAEDETDVAALRNARKEEDQMYKLDFDEELDDDLEKNLLNIEKFGIKYLELRSRESVQREIADLEEEHRRREETLRNEMEILEEKQIEQSSLRSSANITEVTYDCEEDLLKAFQVSIPLLECHDLYKELLKPSEEEEMLLKEAEQVFIIGRKPTPQDELDGFIEDLQMEEGPVEPSTSTSVSATVPHEEVKSASGQKKKKRPRSQSMDQAKPDSKKQKTESEQSSDKKKKTLKTDRARPPKKATDIKASPSSHEQKAETKTTKKERAEKETTKGTREVKELKETLHAPSVSAATKAPLVTLPKDQQWKPHEDAALLKAVEILGEVNWGAVKDALTTYQYPASSNRTPEQCKQRYTQLSSSQKEQSKSMSQLSYDARKQNLSKMLGIWFKKQKKQKTSDKQKKKKKPKPSPLMPPGVTTFKPPNEYAAEISKLLEANAPPSETPSANNSNTITSTTLPARFKTPSQKTLRPPTQPSTAITFGGTSAATSTTPQQPPSTSNVQSIQRRTKKSNPTPPSAPSPTPVQQQPQSNLIPSNVLPVHSTGTFTSLMGISNPVAPMNPSNPTQPTQFQRPVSGTASIPLFMTGNPVFSTTTTGQPNTIGTAGMPPQTLLNSGRPTGALSSLLASQTNPTVATTTTNSMNFAKVVTDKHPQSAQEVTAIISQPLSDPQKLTLLLQVYQKYENNTNMLLQQAMMPQSFFNPTTTMGFNPMFQQMSTQPQQPPQQQPTAVVNNQSIHPQHQQPDQQQ